jgi:murein DD-endopeptidase MepM/ murein hydrolase activator NlpD
VDNRRAAHERGVMRNAIGSEVGVRSKRMRVGARVALVLALGAAACGPPPDSAGPRPGAAPAAAPLPPPLPDETGWGVPVLITARSPGGDLWVGTAGRGMYVLRNGATEWQHIGADTDNGNTIASDHVNSFAFQGDSIIWYGTVGAGFGATGDGGTTWSNWSFDRIGSQWQYVAHNGIRVGGDTVYIATTDGVRVTSDGGSAWRCVQARQPVDGGGARPDGCTQHVAGLPSKYALAISLDPRGTVWIGHLEGLSFSRDAGVTWSDAVLPETDPPTGRVRAVATGLDSVVWAASERAIFVDSVGDGGFARAPVRPTGWDALPGPVRAIVPGAPGLGGPAFATSFGLAAPDAAGRYRVYYLAAGETYRPAADIWHMIWWGPPLWPIGAAQTGLSRVLAGQMPFRTPPRPTAVAQPEEPRRPWLARPIADGEGNPYVDALQRYGGTAGGRAPELSGIALHNPAGTPVRAVAAGRVVYAGEAAGGSNTVAILHDTPADGARVFTTYAHNRAIEVSVGQAVAAGDVIARVGSTGAARSERLHFELHVAPTDDVAAIVGAAGPVPPHAVNPQLWIEPLPGTGIVAGRVLGEAGEPLAGVAVHGLVLAYPNETPYTGAETYGAAARADPLYGENFAVGDVPAGTYTIGVEIDGRRVWRRVVVAPGMVTFVELRP